MKLEIEKGNLAQVGECVTVLYDCATNPVHPHLASLRPCSIVRIVCQSLDVDLAEALQRVQAVEASSDCEFVLVLDSVLANVVAMQLEYVPCGAKHAWSWRLLWSALDRGMAFGSDAALPWVTLSRGRLVTMSAELGPCYVADGAVDLALGVPALCLTGIYLPDNLRRLGYGQEILTHLAARAERDGQRLVVAPILEDAMVSLCRKLGYSACAPFGMLKPEAKPALVV